MEKHILDEKIKAARITFSLPPGVTSEKTLLSNGMLAYVFHHEKLGQLGRIVLVPYEKEQTRFSFEISGDQNDPMTQKRRQLFEPIAYDMSKKLEMIYGKNVSSTSSPIPCTLPTETEVVKAEIMSCKKCGLVVAMMIYAPDANTSAHLENYARKMFPKVKETNVPTWIVGTEREVLIDGKLAGEALVLKIWPVREESKIIYSTELNAIFDSLINGHC